MNDQYGIDPVFFRKALLGHLQLLASPANEQIRWAQDHNLPIEELRLELDDYMVGVPELMKAGAISCAAGEAIGKLHAHMFSFGGELLLRRDRLNEPEWRAVRTLATDALKLVRAESSPT